MFIIIAYCPKFQEFFVFILDFNYLGKSCSDSVVLFSTVWV